MGESEVLSETRAVARVSSANYDTDFVECPRCQGTGEVEDHDDLFNYEEVPCYECGGTGELEVCANCYDAGCSVCEPTSDAIQGVAPKDSDSGSGAG